MRGWLFIKSITPDILPISIDRGFSSFSPRIFFFFFLPSFSFRGFAPFGFGDLVLRTRDGVRFPRGWSFFSFGRERKILIVNWMISLLKSLDLESSRGADSRRRSRRKQVVARAWATRMARFFFLHRTTIRKSQPQRVHTHRSP